MIALKCSMSERKKSAPTARDYVQDGLIAMWHGIENAGWGVHDSSSPIWKDLIGTNDWTIVNGVWTDNALTNFNGGCSASIASFSGITEPITCEYVFYIDRKTSATTNAIVLHIKDWHSGYSMNRCIVYTTQSPEGLSLKSNSAYGITRDAAISCFSAPMANLSVVYGATNTVKVNGEDVPSGSVRDSWYYDDAPVNCIGDRPAGGRGSSVVFGAIRYYSRALTPAEIAHNYAIDKAMFNLP